MSEHLFREILAEIKDIKIKIGSIESHMDGMEVRMDSMESTLTEHSGLLRALEYRVEENSAQITSVAEDINYIKGEIARLNEEEKKRGVVASTANESK